MTFDPTKWKRIDPFDPDDVAYIEAVNERAIAEAVEESRANTMEWGFTEEPNPHEDSSDL